MVGNACNLNFLKDNTYDILLSFGMTAYLDNLDDFRKFIREAFRITKPSGTIYIGEINDLDKKDIALEMRKKTHKNDIEQLYIPKKIFNEFQDYFNKIDIIDHTDLELKYITAKYRYSVYINLKDI